MRYLTKFQFLNYRKVSLLYIVFILFYFLTGSVDTLRNFKSLNTLVFNRLEKKIALENWRDSTAEDLGLRRSDLLISSRDPSYELSRYEDDITKVLNSEWQENQKVPEDINSFSYSAFELFEKSALPEETPNVIASTLFGLESLRRLRSSSSDLSLAERNSNMLSNEVRLKLKSIYIQGEILKIDWPSQSSDLLFVQLDSKPLDTIHPGNSRGFTLKEAGIISLKISNGRDSLLKKLKVVPQINYQFAFGKRYYHLNSGKEYIISLHHQGLNKYNSTVELSSNQGSVTWIDNQRLLFNSETNFSGTMSVYFHGAKEDSLLIGLSPERSYDLGFVNSQGETKNLPEQSIGLVLLQYDKEFSVNSGVLRLYRGNSSSVISISRGRFEDSQDDISSVDGFLLEAAMLIDDRGRRFSLEIPVVKWVR